MQNRESLIHYARVMLREFRARRHQRRFAAFLLNAAIRATNEALAQRTPAQAELFSGR